METLPFESEESSELFEAVMRLPEKYRIVVHLFYYEDYSVNEIADILKLRRQCGRSGCHAEKSLRSTLKEVWEDDE